jgi:hypothetical protein
MDTAAAARLVDTLWEDEIVPQLTEYIRIPNKSPMFDPKWAEHGYMDDAVRLMEKWARGKLTALPGATLEVVRLPGRTPLIMIDVPASGVATSDDCVILYGHLDKQPEMSGWADGLGRQVVRARRRRRRLRHLRLAGGAAGPGRAEAAARPLRGADRGLRGVRQL